MPKIKPAVEVTLPDGRKVVLAELNSGEVANAMELASATKAEDARRFKTQLNGIRLSIRSVDDRSVTAQDVLGPKLDEMFSMKELSLLGRAWQAMHFPTDEEAAAADQGTKAISG